VEDTFPTLVQPYGVAQLANRSYIVVDISDKDVKIYRADGERIGTAGHAGLGPGEFANIAAAASYRDSIVALDGVRQRITVFDRLGRFARQFDVPPPAITALRVLDDSLFLLIAAPQFAYSGSLIRIGRPNGSIVASFFQRTSYFENVPQVIQHSAVLADGANGRIFAGLTGGDSLFVFDYAGSLIASGPVDTVSPLRSLPRQFRDNHQSPRLTDGNWYFNGSRFLFAVTAARDSSAWLFTAPYDTRRGTDFVEGGTLLVVSANGSSLRARQRQQIGYGLFGRNVLGDPIFLAYADSAHRDFSLGSPLAGERQ
jgi:hypothetical protein